MLRNGLIEWPQRLHRSPMFFLARTCNIFAYTVSTSCEAKNCAAQLTVCFIATRALEMRPYYSAKYHA